MPPRTAFLVIALAGCSPLKQPMPAEKQVTFAEHGHILTNAAVWSPDGKRVVYDVRSDPAGDGAVDPDPRASGPTTPVAGGPTRAGVDPPTGAPTALYAHPPGAAVRPQIVGRVDLPGCPAT